MQVYPERGTVGFGSGLHGWGFTVQRFATMYAAKFGISRGKMMIKLWGDNYFDQGTKKWSTAQFDKNNKKLDRGFCAFILKPIEALFSAVMNQKTDVYTPMLPKLGISIPKENKDDVGKPLLKALMQEWLPAANALLNMICNHLPSPAIAQAYRIENLYSGPMDDEVAKGQPLPDALLCQPSLALPHMFPSPSSSHPFPLLLLCRCLSLSLCWPLQPSARATPTALYACTCPRWCRPVRRAASTPSAACSPASSAPGRRCASRARTTCRARRPTCT